MFYKYLFRRAFALQFATTSGLRGFAASAMAVPPESFTLDRSIFNDNLHSRMYGLWFAGMADGASTPPFETMKKWYGIGLMPEDKAAFDDECRKEFGDALQSVGPDKIALPPFESYERDIEEAGTIASPFVSLVKEIQTRDEKKAADVLISLILLLDQIPRNIFRDLAGLRLVYNHYDRLAFSLLYSSLRLTPNPTEYEGYRFKPVYKGWNLMPLMHSEHIPSHELLDSIMASWRADAESANNTEVLEYLEQNSKAGDSHRKPLEQFGRYPHRNQCLGRTNTADETEFLKTAETFGVKQNQDEGKTEL